MRIENEFNFDLPPAFSEAKKGAVTFGKTEKVRKSIKKDHIYIKKRK